MDIDTKELKKRLVQACAKNSLREVADFCKVSHEQIRSCAFGNALSKVNITTYTKINDGLKTNGF